MKTLTYLSTEETPVEGLLKGVGAAATYIGCSKASIYKALETGRITSLRLNDHQGTHFFSPSLLVEEMRNGPKQ